MELSAKIVSGIDPSLFLQESLSWMFDRVFSTSLSWYELLNLKGVLLIQYFTL